MPDAVKHPSQLVSIRLIERFGIFTCKAPHALHAELTATSYRMVQRACKEPAIVQKVSDDVEWLMINSVIM